MTTTAGRPLADRVRGLLDHLGIPKAHFALHCFEPDWPRLLAAMSPRIAGLALVYDRPGEYSTIQPLASRTLAITGDDPSARQEELRKRLAALPVARLVTLQNYSLVTWSDIAADRPDDVVGALTGFFGGIDEAAPVALHAAGEHEEITYRAAGSGPTLVLFPLSLAASQWDPVLPALQQRFTTIVLGGPHIGPVASLEARARGGYLHAVRALLAELDIEPGHRVLEVGCGSGALVRYLAAHSPGISITAADINRFLLGEAQALAKRDGLLDRITFKEGNACDLPFPDGSFDRVFSSTVMEEVDADKMMAELVRVTRPGGRVGVMTRSVDRPRWVNAPLPPELRGKADHVSGGLSPGGCADASLYDRFPRAGLRDVRMLPQLAIMRVTPAAVEEEVAPHLTREEAAALHTALEQAVKSGTFFVAATFHAAVGTKP